MKKRWSQCSRSLALAVGYLVVLVGAAISASCTNPVHDALVTSLGGEVPNVPQGEYHRAGQPCTACHADTGPAKTTFTMAGTVFFGPNTLVGTDQISVVMVDSADTSFTAVTNCVGNFFVTPDEWNPAFPVRVELQKNGVVQRAMVSHIGREPSCGNCHKDPPYFDTPGHVRLGDTDTGYQIPPCPVNPALTPPPAL